MLSYEDPKYYEELDHSKANEKILGLLEPYDFQILTNKTEGYEKQTDDFKSLRIVNDSGHELFVDITEDEVSLFFGDWHAHYGYIKGDFEEFLETLDGILNNRIFTVGAFSEGKWSGSFLGFGEKPDREKLKNEFGKKLLSQGVEVRCSFWDGSKNEIITIKK